MLVAEAPITTIRHDIDPALVQGSIDYAVAKYESRRGELKRQAAETFASYSRALADGTARNWTRAPEGPGYVDPMIDGSIARERNHYARVRIIETQGGDNPGFRLVYGDQPDDGSVGSGPFDSLGMAESWFLGQGR